jgi:hypothetical protein
VADQQPSPQLEPPEEPPAEDPEPEPDSEAPLAAAVMAAAPSAGSDLQRARHELQAARVLLEHDGTTWIAAAGHVHSGWTALAAHLGGDDVADTLEGKLPAVFRKAADWRAGYTSLGRVGPDLSLGADRQTQRALRRGVQRQARLLDRAVSASGPRDRRSWRGPLIALIVLGLIPLGRVLTREDVTTAPSEPVERPEQVRTELSALPAAQANGDAWDQVGNVLFQGQARVDLERAWRPTALDIGLDHNDGYTLEFRNADGLVDSIDVGPSPPGLVEFGMRAYHLELPSSLAEVDVDHVVIKAVAGDGSYSVGHLVLTE